MIEIVTLAFEPVTIGCCIAALAKFGGAAAAAGVAISAGKKCADKNLADDDRKNECARCGRSLVSLAMGGFGCPCCD